jgi:hypothetical protein
MGMSNGTTREKDMGSSPPMMEKGMSYYTQTVCDVPELVMQRKVHAYRWM